ncbi:MAG: tRNA 2-thiouridine(34) synthase MnmA [Candidatus Vogelbacteria bacterium]|nr:tRNA 2-thiouridine(34) synthase MnmA [Candidatus Vogelbacteria bacterium]
MAKARSEKVFVAMSGGVDSSVAAALLKKRGYEVVGVFIKIEVADTGGCDWREERRDARRAAAALKIPLLTFDLSREYQQSVIDYLVREYGAGRTANPDVMCNKQIKFGAFFREAIRQGADLIATGHYAKLEKTSNLKLQISKDEEKDQTYFLWSIKSEILKNCLFPIGDYKKAAVRQLAQKFGLPNAAKPDSQGLCFLGQFDFKDWLAKFLPENPGLVLSEAGQVIGRHRGVQFYTIGERHGFTITKPLIGAGPHYVVAKDIVSNTLTVAAKLKQSEWSVREIKLAEPNWFGDLPKEGRVYSARLRYRAPLAPCRINAATGEIKVIFDKPQNGVTPGQSCVIYDHDVCLGGGVIF